MAGFNVFPAALTKGTPCPSANILALLPIIISIGVAGIKLALNPADTPAKAAAIPIIGFFFNPAYKSPAKGIKIT